MYLFICSLFFLLWVAYSFLFLIFLPGLLITHNSGWRMQTLTYEWGVTVLCFLNVSLVYLRIKSVKQVQGDVRIFLPKPLNRNYLAITKQCYHLAQLRVVTSWLFLDDHWIHFVHKDLVLLPPTFPIAFLPQSLCAHTRSVWLGWLSAVQRLAPQFWLAG